MKRIITMLALAAAAMTTMNAQNISKLWKNYESAVNADKPKTQMEVLTSIKKMAREQHLAWDYYKACTTYAEVGRSVNWKMRDSLYAALDAEIEAFDEPVVTIYHKVYRNKGIASKYAEEHKEVLKAGHHKEFYEEDYMIAGRIYGPVLQELFDNDYEFATWLLYVRGYHGARQLVEAYEAGRYPQEAFCEWESLDKADNNLREYAAKHSGKAVALFARQEQLSRRFSKLMDGGKSADYEQLRKDCGTFVSDAKRFTGIERKIADCCNSVDYLISDLDGKNLSFSVSRGEMTVSFKNLKSASYTIYKDKEKVAEGTVKNTIGSYYITDRIKHTLPDIDDGEYTIKCKSGSHEDEKPYTKHNLSVVMKNDSRGFAVFVADAWSGKPLEKCDITLYKGDDEVIRCNGVTLNGFTYLPQEIMAVLDGLKAYERSSYCITCSHKDASGRLRTTGRRSITTTRASSDATEDKWYGTLIQDRAAFNPGEQVHFKGIVYHGDMRKALATGSAGEKVKVEFLDAQSAEVASKELTTNAMGSVAGEFDIPAGRRGGIYRIRLIRNGAILATSNIRVDEFVLPTYELNFDDSGLFYLTGDGATVSGTIKSYSGHTLEGADATYSIDIEGEIAAEGRLEIGNGGTFSIEVPSKKERTEYWNYFTTVTVKVTDATGETHQWQKTLCMQRNIPFGAQVTNKEEGRVRSTEVAARGSFDSMTDVIISGDSATIRFDVLRHKGLAITYTAKRGKVIVSRGSAQPGETVAIALPGPSGSYTIEVAAACRDEKGEERTSTHLFNVVKVNEADTALDAPVKDLFRVIDGDDIAVQFGACDGPVWACVEVYGVGNVPLVSKLVHLEGRQGAKGSLTTLRYAFDESWSNVVSLKVIYLKDGSVHEWSRDYTRKTDSLALPLSFTRFTDSARPGSKVTIGIKTLPGVECAASVYDKSTDTIQSNLWGSISLLPPTRPNITYNTTTGEDQTGYVPVYYATADKAAGGRMLMKSASARNAMVESAMVSDCAEEVIEEDSMPVQLSDSAAAEEVQEVAVRDNFASTLAFEPYLRSDASGEITLSFDTADKLSTYYVYLYAHDGTMHNARLRQEMVVTIPVKVSVVQPQALYVGDHYVLKAAVASNLKQACSGTLSVKFISGDDYKTGKVVASQSKAITLKAMGNAAEEFAIDVPDVPVLGMLVTFNAGSEASDAMFVTAPVAQPVQTLTESYSAVLHPGDDEAALEASLREQFVNVQGSEAELKVVTLLDMVREALPAKCEPSGKDVLALADALYARLLATSIGGQAFDNAELLDKIHKCQNEDGGFAWIEGMHSSPIVTATLLQRYGAARKRGLSAQGEVKGLEKAVKYLDKVYFGDDNHYWFSCISLDQYLHVRAFFPEVAFDTKGLTYKQKHAFRKDAREYLVPGAKRGLNGMILSKARRMRTLMLLSASEEGRDLAGKWGIHFSGRLTRSLRKDVESILEYAVSHKCGGMYYPNAVMPFRGLMESELYAHSLICDLLRDCTSQELIGDEKVSDGIRLWLMIQKETQQWGSDAAFVEAIASVLDGSQEVLDTKIMVLSKTYSARFENIQKSGNGMSIERKYYKAVTENGKESRIEIKESDVLSVGDIITAEYLIWSEENRSFVHVNAGRPACFRPVEQLSGHCGWWASPLRVAGWYTFTPQGYRNVRKDGTDYWFDAFPEEKTTITEQFYVTQKGRFQQPVIETVCLYAPHYRANDGAGFSTVASE